MNDAYVRALFEAAANEPRVQHHGLVWTAALLFEAKRDPVRMKRQLYRAWQNCPGSKGALGWERAPGKRQAKGARQTPGKGARSKRRAKGDRQTPGKGRQANARQRGAKQTPGKGRQRCLTPPLHFLSTALTKTALALLGPAQSDEELQEIFSVAEDKEQRLRTLMEELAPDDGSDVDGDADGDADGEAAGDGGARMGD